MDIVLPGVHASNPERLSFAPTIGVRAFLLRRAGGNLLVYSAPTVVGDAGEIDALGGVVRHYLGHWHEAGLGCDRVVARLKAPLSCHEDERPLVEKSCPVDATFAERHRLDDDFEVIPIPGHTGGSTAYLWDSGQRRCLFTADTVYLRDGEWVAAVLEGSSDRQAYLASLALLKELEFDVLIPWAATHGKPFHAATDRADAGRRLDAIIDRLRRGEDH
jgi:glyoxylase-like metal-dependent hydrolase (beta-lactamase superfamily II)